MSSQRLGAHLPVACRQRRETVSGECLGCRLREFVLWLFVAGAATSAIDLVVLGHFEDLKQWVPLVLLTASLLVVGWHRLGPGCQGLRALRGIMALFIAGGVVGLWFHCSGNMAFELEMSPGAAGWELLRGTLTGAIPALAPGLMIQLGLLGLIYTYRHPLLEPGQPGLEASEERKRCQIRNAKALDDGTIAGRLGLRATTGSVARRDETWRGEPEHGRSTNSSRTVPGLEPRVVDDR